MFSFQSFSFSLQRKQLDKLRAYMLIPTCFPCRNFVVFEVPCNSHEKHLTVTLLEWQLSRIGLHICQPWVVFGFFKVFSCLTWRYCLSVWTDHDALGQILLMKRVLFTFLMQHNVLTYSSLVSLWEVSLSATGGLPKAMIFKFCHYFSISTLHTSLHIQYSML